MSIFSSIRLSLTKSKTLWWNGTALTNAPKVEPKPLELLVGVEDQKNTLLENTAKFNNHKPALNALLWGARGMGKSTLVKSVVAQFDSIYLVGIDRKRLITLELLYKLLGGMPTKRFVLFLDEISFRKDEDFPGFKSLIEGSVMSQPSNVLLYATSNRRRITEYEDNITEFVSPSANDDLDDQIALADRFGLRLGFHNPNQELWQNMVRAHLKKLGKSYDNDALKQAESWSISYGGKSGRSAELFAISR